MDNTKVQENHRLYSAIKKLKPEYREVLTHVYFEELGYEEVGKIMNKSKGQIMSLLARAKTELKEHFVEQ